MTHLPVRIPFYLLFLTITDCCDRLHTSRMSLSKDVDLEEFVMAKDDMSGADIKAVCIEAGLLVLRERWMRVTKVYFMTAREKVGFVLFVRTDVIKNANGVFRSFTGRTRVHQRVFTSRLVHLYIIQ